MMFTASPFLNDSSLQHIHVVKVATHKYEENINSHLQPAQRISCEQNQLRTSATKAGSNKINYNRNAYIIHAYIYSKK